MWRCGMTVRDMRGSTSLAKSMASVYTAGRMAPNILEIGENNIISGLGHYVGRDGREFKALHLSSVLLSAWSKL